jgi:CHRD domain
MSKKVLVAAVLIAIAIVTALVVGRARATPSTYALKATLSTQSSVKDATGAHGTLAGKLTVNGKHSAFLWTLRFNNLSGQAKRAGIYFSKTKQLAMLLCLKCTSGAQSSYHGSYVASKPFLNAILHGGTYVSIRTKLNPNGEVRGQLRATAG